MATPKAAVSDLEDSINWDFSVSNSQDVTEALLAQVNKQKLAEEKAKTPKAGAKPAAAGSPGPRASGARKAASLLRSAAHNAAASATTGSSEFDGFSSTEPSANSPAHKRTYNGSSASKGKASRRSRVLHERRDDAGNASDQSDDREVDEDEEDDEDAELDRAAEALSRRVGNGSTPGGKSARHHLKDLKRSHKALAKKRPAEMRLLASFLAQGERAKADKKMEEDWLLRLHGRPTRSSGAKSDSASDDDYSNDDSTEDSEKGEGEFNGHFRVSRACALALPKHAIETSAIVGGSIDAARRSLHEKSRVKARRVALQEKRERAARNAGESGDAEPTDKKLRARRARRRQARKRRQRFSSYDDAENCTFHPQLRSSDGGESKESDGDDSDGGRREKGMDAFLRRATSQLRDSRSKQDRKVKEAAYEARLDKMICPQCGAVQSYDEFEQRKKFCQVCEVAFRNGTFNTKVGRFEVVCWGRRDDNGDDFLAREEKWRAKRAQRRQRQAHKHTSGNGVGSSVVLDESDVEGSPSPVKKAPSADVLRLQQRWAKRVEGRGDFLTRVRDDIDNRQKLKDEGDPELEVIRDSDFVYGPNDNKYANKHEKGWVHKVVHHDTHVTDLFKPKLQPAENAFLFKPFLERVMDDVAFRQARQAEFDMQLSGEHPARYIDPMDGGPAHEDIDLWHNDEETVNASLAHSLH